MKTLPFLLIAILGVVLVACSGSGGSPLDLSNAVSEGLATPTTETTPQALALLPSPTPPVIDLSPYDGDSQLYVFPDDATGEIVLYIEDDPNNLDVDNAGNGRGIRYVDFFIYDAQGREVDFKRENGYPYCYFGDTNRDCNGWVFSRHSNQFPLGHTARDRVYFVRAVEYSSVSNKMRVDEDTLELNQFNGEPTGANVFIDRLGERTNYRNDGLDGLYEVEFRAEGSSFGWPIDRVEMSILSPNGTVVHRSTDREPPYCAFGDAGSDSCVNWVFKRQGNKWPSGKPVYNAMYTFRVVAYNGNTAIAADTETDIVDSPQTATAPPPQPPPPPSGGSASGYNAILADGQNDVDQVYGRLVFRTRAGDGNDGDNIDHVAMSIVDEDGNTVHVKDPESSPKYCAFGGNEFCNAWVFSDEGYRWSNGAQINDNARYTLYATIYFHSNKDPLTLSRTVTVHY